MRQQVQFQLLPMSSWSTKGRNKCFWIRVPVSTCYLFTGKTQKSLHGLEEKIVMCVWESETVIVHICAQTTSKYLEQYVQLGRQTHDLAHRPHPHVMLYIFASMFSFQSRNEICDIWWCYYYNKMEGLSWQAQHRIYSKRRHESVTSGAIWWINAIT